MVWILLACSNGYELNSIDEKANEGATDESAETDSNIDTTSPSTEDPPEESDEDSPIPEEPVDTNWEENPEYCTPFEDFSEWNYFGDGNWHIENNLLYENQGGYYATTAYLYDFGTSEAFSMETQIQWQGSLNDQSGFAFGLDPQSGFHWTVTIDDPQGDYGRYSPAGAILVSHCIWETCSVIAQDHQLEMNVASNSPSITLSMEVMGEELHVYWNGNLAFSQTISGLQGPGIVGLYSNDNDGGVVYDDFCIYVSP